MLFGAIDITDGFGIVINVVREFFVVGTFNNGNILPVPDFAHLIIISFAFGFYFRGRMVIDLNGMRGHTGINIGTVKIKQGINILTITTQEAAPVCPDIGINVVQPTETVGNADEHGLVFRGQNFFQARLKYRVKFLKTDGITQNQVKFAVAERATLFSSL